MGLENSEKRDLPRRKRNSSVDFLDWYEIY